MARVFNFGAGPAALPLGVLEEVQGELVDYQGTGMSILESSHRGKAYAGVHDEAVANLKQILGIRDSHTVMFLAGGASGQFAMLPMNLLADGQTADYIHTGAWAGKAIKEAQVIGEVNLAADTSEADPARMPTMEELRLTPGAAYVHMTSNETIGGTQWKTFPETEAPLVADMSSDFLSRPFDMARFGMVYAGAQKNVGPSGVAVVVMRNDLIERCRPGVPRFWRYKTHAEANSLYNTPPCFAIYMIALVTRRLIKEGMESVYRRNVDKAARLYAAIDGSEFYRGTAAAADRSDMNVTFRLPTEELEGAFVAEAAKRAMKGLKGHRSVGGIRASIYNAFPVEGVDALVEFMGDFERANG